MDEFWKGVLRRQFGAAIDMMENAMRVCPEDVWCDLTKKPEWVDNGNVVNAVILNRQLVAIGELVLTGQHRAGQHEAAGTLANARGE